VASLSQGRTAAAQCGLFTHKSVPVIFEPPCTFLIISRSFLHRMRNISERRYQNIHFVLNNFFSKIVSFEIKWKIL